jgi:hypothetical protein
VAALQKIDRRKEIDRRSNDNTTGFPLFDGEETLVLQDRRIHIDRRSGDRGDTENVSNYQEKTDNRLFIWFKDDVLEVEREDEEFWLGRSKNCLARITNRYVSRQHARLCFEDNAYYLIDNSSNGTFVKTEKNEDLVITKDRMLVKGSGIISLGMPVEKAGEHVVHYFIG